MRAIFVFCALVALAVAEKCSEPTGDVAAKQAKIEDVVSHINKPFAHTGGSCHDVPPLDADKMKGIGLLDEDEVFSLFDERLWPEAGRVIKVLLEAPTFDDFIATSRALSHNINQDLFFYCFTVAVNHRKDCGGLHAPHIYKIYPDKFIRQTYITKIKEHINCGHDNLKVHVNPYLFNNTDSAHALLYFLEDPGLNMHHFHWHAVHPAIWDDSYGRHKDRRGELFYWMHQQMIARYDVELLSNGLPAAPTFENFDEPIEQGFAPDLTIDHIGYRYMFRPDHMVLRDLPELTKNQLRLWRVRILNAIHAGHAHHKNGQEVDLVNKDGIDVLAKFVESSAESINRPYYGNIHCYAHVIASRIADPDGKFGEDNGAMYDVTTSARDPLFYSWHKFINSLFVEHKEMLTPYTENQLGWNDVVVEKVHVKGRESGTDDELHTYWKTATFPLTKGFSFTRDKDVEIEMRHLAHEEFDYAIDVKNNAGAKKAIVRVFIAPVHHLDGTPLTPNEIRLNVIQLDTWVVDLVSGANHITRKSEASGVSFHHVEDKDEECVCGWPHNLLIPRGNYEGLDFHLFAIVSEKDGVDEEACHCDSALSYCGTMYGKHPSDEALGYPFDRRIDDHTIQEFMTPNMAMTELTIKFTGEKH